MSLGAGKVALPIDTAGGGSEPARREQVYFNLKFTLIRLVTRIGRLSRRKGL